MSADKRINYVELPGDDLDAIEKFYSTIFGWTFVHYGDEYRSFNDGTLDGGFFKSKLKSTTENGAALIVLFSDNLEQIQDEVVANRGTVCKEIFSFPGGRRFHFHDPHGNELAIWSDK